MPYNDDIQAIWEEVREQMKDNMPESAVNLWFGDITAVNFDGYTVYLEIISEFKYNTILKRNHLKFIESEFSEYMGFPIKVDLKFSGTPITQAEIEEIKKRFPRSKEINDEIERKINSEKQAYREEYRERIENSHPDGEEDPTLKIPDALPLYKFEYTFENFIVGNSNRFAHAACSAVADFPSKDYNPLFIYGPSGLGKTHLLYAIINRMKKNTPKIRIVYIKGDDFTNQMIECLSQQKMNEFHERYRSCDVLLIDDIQFIAGKVATQEEFFHTFNALYEERKQIILTSDRPPREIKTLEDRLKTRFEMGLIADIQPPDVELRTAIIKKKAEQVNIVVPDDVLVYLAENLRSNIRQLEGAIKKLAALSFLSGKPITMETAEGCISELLGGAEPVSVTVDKIFSVVYKKYGISREQIAGKSREKEIVAARHILNYLVRTVTEMSYPNLAKLTNRNHATVMASMEAINKKMVTNPAFGVEIKNLIKDITGEDPDNKYDD